MLLFPRGEAQRLKRIRIPCIGLPAHGYRSLEAKTFDDIDVAPGIVTTELAIGRDKPAHRLAKQVFQDIPTCGAFMPYLGHAGFGQNRVTERVCADQHACLAQIAQLFCVEREIVGKSAWLISAMRSIVSCCTAGA